MKTEHKAIATAFASGLLFGGGLIIGGMTQPAKVIGFLDFFGDWDPSLAFVMGGALLVVLTLQRFVVRRRGPLYAVRFGIPSRNDIDAQLLIGAALFGLGWGLGGFCPGPAITSVGGAMPQAFVFVTAMLVGFGLKRLYDWMSDRRKDDTEAEHPPGGVAAKSEPSGG